MNINKLIHQANQIHLNKLMASITDKKMHLIVHRHLNELMSRIDKQENLDLYNVDEVMEKCI